MVDRDASVSRDGQTLGHAPRYLVHLLCFICFVTFFEGYDLLIINLALPALGEEFKVGAEGLGYAVGLINAGTVAAFVPMQFADRYGRRPVFLLAACGYTLFTVLTVLSTSIHEFVAYQFVARMFMVTEIGLGAIILTEEMPANRRGAAVTLMFACSLLGGVAASLFFQVVDNSGYGWRMLYLAGAGLVPILLIYWRRFTETRRWQDDQRERGRRTGSVLRDLRRVSVIASERYRRRAICGIFIWFAVNAWSSCCLFFFAYYATKERGWTATELGTTLSIGYMLAIFGYAAAGPMLEVAGRRVTACVYFTVGSIAAITCFLSDNPVVIAVAYIVVLGMQALFPIAATITSEIFPTDVRGLANGVVNNLIGRTGMMLAPAAVGALSVWYGSVGQAAATIAILPLLCLPIIVLLLSETRGRVLEEIA